MSTAKIALACLLLAGCAVQPEPALAPAPPQVTDPAAFWNSATIYFLLTDRFENGDPSNDLAVGRVKDGAVLRNFEGGDLVGLRRRIESGYFDSLGVHAIWLTPFVAQIRAAVNEGTGKTYGFHGYWTRDWTAVDPALGTEEDLRAMIDAAHRRGIRVLMDAVINHTGPVTPQDPAWPAGWVRTTPQCTYQSYTTTVDCTLVATLPDIRTDSNEPVAVPQHLIAQWDAEGRLAREVGELTTFFERTRYPAAPRYYLIKWLTDWVREFGFDGYRVDTAKHFEESISAELKREAEIAFADWKQANPGKVIDDLPFYMMGEVYGYAADHGRSYDFGDRRVDYYAHGYDGLINFGFKSDTAGPIDGLFSRYAATLTTGALQGKALVNYVSSHDDGGPYDRDRRDPFGAGTRLLLAPGGAQIYYGDELARPLRVAGAEGDANLRSRMNWSDLSEQRTREILAHWQKLGQFRRAHPAVGSGMHRALQANPYIFSRVLAQGNVNDRVVVAIGLPSGNHAIPVSGVFADGTWLRDAYGGSRAQVRAGTVNFATTSGLLLLAETPPPR
jgi:alpha-amylase